MPLDSIERAIKRASGQSEGTALAEATFEGYGPGGAAILVQVLTDNRNRTLAEVRHTFTRSGSSLGESGCVSWLFEPKGVLTLQTDAVDAEALALSAIDAGADDVKVESDAVEVYTTPADLERVRKTLEQGFTISSTELSLVPKTVVKLDEKTALQALRLLESLEELEDVQQVYTNADFPNEVIEKLRG
jgi:YebC/PmpR family DNA-binding regulatory protein